jgi:hypothetical protein
MVCSGLLSEDWWLDLPVWRGRLHARYVNLACVSDRDHQVAEGRARCVMDGPCFDTSNSSVLVAIAVALLVAIRQLVLLVREAMHVIAQYYGKQKRKRSRTR